MQKKKNGFNEKQKEAILKYIEDKMLGKVLLEPASTKEEVQKTLEKAYLPERYQEPIETALKKGKTIYKGYVNFEECEYSYVELFEELFKVLEENGNGDFETIDGDLSY